MNKLNYPNRIKYIVSACVLTVLAADAQPVVTVANEVSIGTSFTHIFLDAANILEGGSGANQTWDFTQVTPDGTTRVDNWIAPAGTPFAANFPNADIVQEINAGSTYNIYLYHTLSSTNTELLGIAFDIGSGVSNIFDYSDTENLREFPATYNSTLNDTYAGVMTLSSPIPTTTYRNGTYSYIVDAYGSLTTLNGTFPNTLRFKTRQVHTDSTVYSGFPLPPVVQHYRETAYFWTSADAGDKLYQFYLSYDTTTTSTGTTTEKFSSYSQLATGMNDEISLKSSLAIYPVPAFDMATIKIQDSPGGEGVLEILEVTGKCVSTFMATMQKSDSFEWTFPVHDLEAGLYLVRLHCNGNEWQQRFVKK